MSTHVSQERLIVSASGYGYLFLAIGLAFVIPAALWTRPGPVIGVLLAVTLLLGIVWCLAGLYVLQPNQPALLMLFGAYRGTDRGDGLRWANPFFVKRKVSVRAHNFNSEKLKVNDLRGNPIEIAAAVVWRVEDTARATFDVEDFEAYVLTQAEAAVRHIAARYAYDNFEEPGAGGAHETTLRSGAEVVGASLREELQARFAQAGIVVLDAKLTHLAYAPEIAGTMLRRQQAEAVIAARSKIVQGAVGMVEAALKGLSERDVVHLDDERKAAMVSNLLVVLCGDRDVSPVVNTGTLYG